MKFTYRPKSKLEKFGVKVYNSLVDNFPRTFFVGGMVRDLLLGREVRDIDLATEAMPEQVARILQAHGIETENQYQKLGIVIAPFLGANLSITTYRVDIYRDNRYPKVIFTADIKEDAKRRDFTINSLYLSVKDNKILDFCNGLGDLNNRLIRFIGDPDKRIKEDPLRILRAIRFVLVLNFKLEKNSHDSIMGNFELIESLTESRKQKEIDKTVSETYKNEMKNILNDKTLLDKYL